MDEPWALDSEQDVCVHYAGSELQARIRIVRVEPTGVAGVICRAEEVYAEELRSVLTRAIKPTDARSAPRTAVDSFGPLGI